MIVNVELKIEVTGNVTEEEVAEFFHHEYGGCPCPSTIHYYGMRRQSMAIYQKDPEVGFRLAFTA